MVNASPLADDFATDRLRFVFNGLFAAYFSEQVRARLTMDILTPTDTPVPMNLRSLTLARYQGGMIFWLCL